MLLASCKNGSSSSNHTQAACQEQLDISWWTEGRFVLLSTISFIASSNELTNLVIKPLVNTNKMYGLRSRCTCEAIVFTVAEGHKKPQEE